MVLNAVRISASCCSLATDKNRFQITSKVTGSMALAFISELYNNIVSLIYSRPATGTHHERRLALFNNRRSVEVVTRFKGGALVNRRFHIATLLRKVSPDRKSTRLNSSHVSES